MKAVVGIAAVMACCAVHAAVLAGVTGWLTGSLFLGAIATLVVVAVVAVVHGRSSRACDG